MASKNKPATAKSATAQTIDQLEMVRKEAHSYLLDAMIADNTGGKRTLLEDAKTKDWYIQLQKNEGGTASVEALKSHIAKLDANIGHLRAELARELGVPVQGQAPDQGSPKRTWGNWLLGWAGFGANMATTVVQFGYRHTVGWVGMPVAFANMALVSSLGEDGAENVKGWARSACVAGATAATTACLLYPSMFGQAVADLINPLPVWATVPMMTGAWFGFFLFCEAALESLADAGKVNLGMFAEWWQGNKNKQVEPATAA